jgi:hypothetical protein
VSVEFLQPRRARNPPPAVVTGIRTGRIRMTSHMVARMVVQGTVQL